MKKYILIFIGGLLLSACDGTLEYDASNLVRIDAGQYIYRIPIHYRMENGNARADEIKEKQVAVYCPTGYQTLERTVPEITKSITGGFYGTAYVPSSTYARYYITVKCAR